MAGEDIVVNILGNDDLSPIIAAIAEKMGILAGTVDALDATASGLSVRFHDLTAIGGQLVETLGSLDEVAPIFERLAGATDTVDVALRDAVLNAQGSRDAFAALTEATTSTDSAMAALSDKLGGLMTDFPSFAAQGQFLTGILDEADISGIELAAGLDTMGAALTASASKFEVAAQSAVNIATAYGDAGVSMDAIRARSATLKDATTALNDTIDKSATDLAKWIAEGRTLGLVTTENEAGFQALQDTLARASAGIDGLSGAFTKLDARGTMTRATIAKFNAILDEVTAAAKATKDLGFDVLGAGMVSAAEKGYEALSALRTQMDLVAQVAGTDNDAFLGLTQAIAQGSIDMGQAGVVAGNMTDSLAAMQAMVLQDSGGLSTLSAALADLVIRVAAANDVFAAHYNISQQMAQKYIEASDEAKIYADALTNVKDRLAIGSKGVADWVAAMEKAGVTIQGLSGKSKSEFDSIRLDLQGIGRDAAANLGTAIETAASKAASALRGATVAMDDFVTAGNNAVTVAAKFREMGVAIDNATMQTVADLTQVKLAMGAIAAESDMLTGKMMEGWFGSAGAGEINAYKAEAYQAEQAQTMWNTATLQAGQYADVYAGNLAGAEARLGGFSGAVSGAAEGLGRQWMNLGLAAGALDMFGAKAITSGGEFQRQMNINANLAANGKDNIAEMTQVLLDAGPTWGRTPLELAQGLYYVMSDGIHGADALNVLKEAAYASSGGLGKFSDMARGITILMNNFGSGMKDSAGNVVQLGISSQDAADIVIQAVTAGSTTVEEFAKNLGKIAPTAADAGYSVKTMATGFDVMTRAGIPSANAATYLRAVMMSIGDRANEVATKAQGYGVALDGATLSQKGMAQDGTGLVKQLQYIHDGVIKASYAHGDLAHQTAWAQDTWINLIGGIRSGQGALAMSAQDFANYSSVLAQWNQNTGQSTTALGHFQAMNKTFAFGMMEVKARLSSLADQFMITYGDQIGAMLVNVANHLKKLQDYMSAHPQAFMHAVLAIFALLNGAFLASLLAAGGGMLGFFRHGEEAARGVERLTRVLEGGRGGMRDMAGAVQTIGHGMHIAGGHAKESEGLFGKLFSSLGSGKGVFQDITTHALRGGTGMLGMFTRNKIAGEMLGETLQGGLKTGARGMAESFAMGYGHGGILHGMLGILGDGAKNLLLTGLHPLAAVGNLVGQGFVGLGKGVTSVLTAVLNPMATLRSFGSMLFSLIPAVVGLGAAILPFIAIALAVAGVIAVVVIAFTHFRKESEAALKPLKEVFTGVFNDIKLMIGGFVLQVQAQWNSLKGAILPAVAQLIKAIGEMKPVWQVLGAVIRVVVAIIIGVLAGLVQGFLHALPYIINTFTGIIHVITTVAQIIIAIFHGQWGKIPGLVMKLFGQVLMVIGTAAHAILTFVGNLVLGIVNWFAKLVGGGPLAPIIHFVQMVISWIQHLFEKIVGHSIIPDLINGIIAWIAKIINAVVHVIAFVAQVEGLFIAFAEKVIGIIVGFVNKIIGAIVGFVATIIGAFVRLREEGIAGFGTFVSTILGAVGGLIGNLVSAFAGLPGQLIGALGDLGGKLAGVAGDAMKAMGDAIRGAIGGLAKAAGDAVGGIIKGAKDALGIKSPSKVFMEIGGYTVDGMALGLLGNAHKVRNASEVAFGSGNMVVGKPGVPGVGGGRGLGGALGGGAAGAGATLVMNIQGSGFQLLDATTRRRIALDIGKELSLATGLQGIQPIGYSGRGTI